MKIGEKIAGARRAQNLTQEQLADLLQVSRQAVSRWENGETAPGIDMVKLICVTFGVPLERFFDMPMSYYCQCCSMPIPDEEMHGTEADGSKSADFCKYCYDHGDFTAKGGDTFGVFKAVGGWKDVGVALEDALINYVTEELGGVITAERLDEAVTRILALKASLHLHKKQADGSIYPDPAAAAKVVGCAEHKRVSKEVAEHSITLVKEEKGVLPITPQRYKRILVYKKEGKASAVNAGITEGAADALIEKLRKKGFAVTVFQPGGGWEGMATPVQEVYDNYDLILYIANLATKSNQTTVRLEWAEPMGADVPVYMHSVPTVFVSLENPYHLLDVPRVKTFINTYGSTEEILDTLVEKLSGESEFCGKSPVDAFCGKWDTRL